MLPYGQWERALKAMSKMEQEDIISRVGSSDWPIPIVMAMKSDGQTRRVCGDYRLILNPRLSRYATTKMEPENVMKYILGNRYFSKIDLTNAYVQIPLSPQFKSSTIITNPWGLFRLNVLPFGLHIIFGDTREEIDL